MFLASIFTAFKLIVRRKSQIWGFKEVVAEILGSFKTNDFRSQVYAIKRELEILIQLNTSEQLRQYILAQTKEIKQLSNNIDEIEDDALVQRLKKIRTIINEIINKIQDDPEADALKERIPQDLKIFHNFYNYFGVRIVIINVKQLIEQTIHSKDVLANYVILNKLFNLLTEVVNISWSIFDDYIHQLMTDFAHAALKLITDKHLHDFEGELRNTDADDIIVSFSKTLREFIEAVLKAQEKTVEKLLDQQENVKLFSGLSFQETEGKPSLVSTFSCKDIYKQALEAAQSPENQRLVDTLDSWTKDYQAKLNEISQL